MGHILDLARRVCALPRLVECRLVDVGCVDLDAIPKRLFSKRACENHRDGVRLLAGGATG